MGTEQSGDGSFGNPRWIVVRKFLFAAAFAIAATGCKRKSSTDAPAAHQSATGATNESAPRTPRQYDLKKPIVEIDTSAGRIVLTLDGMLARGTVRNFLDYANGGFYDNTLVHYVEPGKMILAGGYTTDHKLKRTGTAIRNEAHNGLKNVRGTIAMTRDPAQVDSATTQFFINLVDAPQRDYKGDSPDAYGYCVFGQVTEGLDVAEKISNAPTEDLGGDLARTPKPPVVINSIRAVR